MGIPSSWDYAADVVVVGYGVAGASAAITAHDAGASVIILEKSPHADSGNSGVCGGLSWFPVLSSNGGSIEDFITYMKVSQWGTVADDDLITAFCTGIANLPAWFTSLGAKTTFVTSNCAVPRALVTGLVSPQLSIGSELDELPTRPDPDGSGRSLAWTTWFSCKDASMQGTSP